MSPQTDAMLDEYATGYASTPMTEFNCFMANMEYDRNYWKARCLASEKFISESPCDPDICEDQIKAHGEWRNIVEGEVDYFN